MISSIWQKRISMSFKSWSFWLSRHFKLQKRQQILLPATLLKGRPTHLCNYYLQLLTIITSMMGQIMTFMVKYYYFYSGSVIHLSCMVKTTVSHFWCVLLCYLPMVSTIAPITQMWSTNRKMTKSLSFFCLPFSYFIPLPSVFNPPKTVS